MKTGTQVELLAQEEGKAEGRDISQKFLEKMVVMDGGGEFKVDFAEQREENSAKFEDWEECEEDGSDSCEH